MVLLNFSPFCRRRK